ncbi:hypothetical protein FQA39_LY19154 [Lamprigera yunnana]|nr:hypothetical protein FQA39_LY19154 [Lamprigera yunnana]
MEHLVVAENLTLLGLGLYFGFSTMQEEFEEANRHGIALLQELQVLPTRDIEKRCPNCQAEMNTITDRQRTLGWRYRCNGQAGHRRDPTVNTFTEQFRMNETGSFTIILIIYSWLIGTPETATMVQQRVSAETAMAWYKYCRDVATKIVWHDLGQIGGAQDVVEIGETHLFKRNYYVGRMTMWQITGCLEVLADPPRTGLAYETPLFVWTSGEHIESGHATVNHSQNFVHPALGEDPIWVPVGRFLPVFGHWVGPSPQPNMEPFRVHTNGCKRSWQDLKKTLKTCNSLHLSEGYIGKWMYRKNVLTRNSTLTDKFFRFFQ